VEKCPPSSAEDPAHPAETEARKATLGFGHTTTSDPERRICTRTETAVSKTAMR